MNSKKLIIYDNSNLFNILNEIKENLNFELINANKNNLESIKKDLNSDFIIVSTDEKNSFKHHLILSHIPIRIGKFLELININFLKKKINLQ